MNILIAGKELNNLKNVLSKKHTVYEVNNKFELLEKLKNGMVDYVILSGDLGIDIKEIIKFKKNLLLILDLEKPQQMEVLKIALSLGIYNIIDKKYLSNELVAYRIENPATLDDVTKIIKNEEVTLDTELSKKGRKEKENLKESEIISYWGISDRIGVTSLAISNALKLSKENPNEVVLVDFVEVQPNIDDYLKVKRINSLELLDYIEKDNLDSITIHKFLQKKHGFSILTGVGIENFSFFNQNHFATILKTLKECFRYVIVDTNSGFYFSSTFAALKLATKINVVLIPEIKYLEETKKIIKFIQNRWQIPSEKFQFILNHPGTYEDIGKKEISKIFFQNLIEEKYSEKIAAIRKGRVKELHEEKIENKKISFLGGILSVNRPF